MGGAILACSLPSLPVAGEEDFDFPLHALGGAAVSTGFGGLDGAELLLQDDRIDERKPDFPRLDGHILIGEIALEIRKLFATEIPRDRKNATRMALNRFGFFKC